MSESMLPMEGLWPRVNSLPAGRNIGTKIITSTFMFLVVVGGIVKISITEFFTVGMYHGSS